MTRSKDPLLLPPPSGSLRLSGLLADAGAQRPAALCACRPQRWTKPKKRASIEAPGLRQFKKYSFGFELKNYVFGIRIRNMWFGFEFKNRICFGDSKLKNRCIKLLFEFESQTTSYPTRSRPRRLGQPRLSGGQGPREFGSPRSRKSPQHPPEMMRPAWLQAGIRRSCCEALKS